MSNAFNKEERVAFEQVIGGFEDALVLSNNVSKYTTDGSMMERAGDTIWRPMPYIAQSHDGMDATSNFDDATQLSVPASLGYSKHSTAVLDAKELRDQMREGRLGIAAAQKLASDINLAIMSVAANQGTLVVKRPTAAAGFDDVAQAEAIMNEQGVNSFDRYLALSTRDYNGMAGNLASRVLDNSKSLTAYEKAFVGQIASFDTYKLDYATRLTAALGTTVTISGANQYHTPKATSTASTGETSNYDNRYQNLTVAVTSGTIKVGDAFTIADVYAVHHITKQSTGQLKTFRVTAIVSGGGSTDAELAYQNVDSTPADGAAIVWLNTVAANVNPFWQKDAIEILPGRYAVPTDAGSAILRSTTANGIEIVMQKFYDINTMKTKYRWDTLFGVVNKQPEMSGIILFSQS